MFKLMQRKFGQESGAGAIFYEFLGMSNEGPIVELRQ